MWWPRGHWYGGHATLGSTVAAPKWGVAGIEIDSTAGAGTFLLITSTTEALGDVRLTLVTEDASPGPSLVVPVGPGRLTLQLGLLFAGLIADAAAGVIVESVGAVPAPLVVEASTYENAGGVIWAAGGSTLATPIP